MTRFLLPFLCLCLFACRPQPQTARMSPPLPVEGEYFVPVRAITQGPKHHWFGYYDKWQIDPSGRYVLSNEVDFENRSPTESDVIEVGMVDLQDDDAWIPLSSSRAWNWQQGCMLQFVPGSENLIIWNDQIKSKTAEDQPAQNEFVSHLMDLDTREQRTLPAPIYALSPDGKTALGLDFARLNDMRPGYGYAGIPDPNQDKIAPDNAGIYRLNLETGESRLILTFADMLEKGAPSIDHPIFTEDFPTQKHWFNHLLISPNGERFIFLHRWKSKAAKDVGGFGTLMYTARMDGSDLRLIDASGFTSHFIWRDADHILAWTKPTEKEAGFYLFEDQEGSEPVQIGTGIMTRNGHQTYLPLPGNEWILNDTYPNEDRKQAVYLYHIPTERRIPLGNFYLPAYYKGEWRVDTHPRFSPDGRQVVIDCPNGSSGRQLILLDIGKILK